MNGGNVMGGYNSRSKKAEEFISDEEIKRTLKYAEENKDNIELIRSVLEEAKEAKGLDFTQAMLLLECENEEIINEIFSIAKEVKERFYGNRIVMFAPLYLSNYCVNGCVYCPYHGENRHITRKKLTQEEIRQESHCRIWDIRGSL